MEDLRADRHPISANLGRIMQRAATALPHATYAFFKTGCHQNLCSKHGTRRLEGLCEANSNEQLKQKRRLNTSGKDDSHSKRMRSSIDATRILSNEDFEKIRRLREEYGLINGVEGKRASNSGLKKMSVGDQVRHESATVVRDGDIAFDPNALEAYKARRRQTMEERMLSVLNGREKFVHNTHGGGKTNAEKRRLKNFSMVRNSSRIKGKLNQAKKKSRNKMNKEVKVLKRDLKKRRRT